MSTLVGSIGPSKNWILVSGASTGIGYSIVRRLATKGVPVFAGVRKSTDADRLKSELGPNVHPLILEVTQDASVSLARAEVDRVLSSSGGILYGLVNNAGIVVGGPLEAIAPSHFLDQFNVNVVGVHRLTQAFASAIRASRGRIVNIGSDSGLMAVPFMGPYCASKFAIEAYSDSLRMELSPLGVQVCIVEPGNTQTPIWDKSLGAAESNFATNSEEVRSSYAVEISQMIVAARKLEKNAGSVDLVVNAVEHALLAARPKTRYLIGSDAKLSKFLNRFVPDRIRDRLIRSQMGLK